MEESIGVQMYVPLKKQMNLNPALKREKLNVLILQSYGYRPQSSSQLYTVLYYIFNQKLLENKKKLLFY